MQTFPCGLANVLKASICRLDLLRLQLARFVQIWAALPRFHDSTTDTWPTLVIYLLLGKGVWSAYSFLLHGRVVHVTLVSNSATCPYVSEGYLRLQIIRN